MGGVDPLGLLASADGMELTRARPPIWHWCTKERPGHCARATSAANGVQGLAKFTSKPQPRDSESSFSSGTVPPEVGLRDVPNMNKIRAIQALNKKEIEQGMQVAHPCLSQMRPSR